jgi:1-acyl-sn-glycerol-3-phosphate acyltransferase
VSQVDSFLAGNGLASRAAYRVARTIVVVFTRLYTRMSIEGREHVPRSGPFVLAPVHRSYVDTPIAACVTPRRLRFMGKDTLWKRRVPAWVLSSLGGFPVTRGTADRQALQRCIAVLEAGEPLVLFPEGERKSGPVVQPLFDGAVYVAVKAGVPIVPVGIGGSERVMPKGTNMIFPRKVHVIVGAPIPPPVGDGGRVPRSTLREHSAVLHAELQRLFDDAQARAGTPNEPRHAEASAEEPDADGEALATG